MKNFFRIMVLILVGVIFFSCGNTAEIQVKKLYSKETREDGIKMLKKETVENAYLPLSNVLNVQDNDIINAAIEVMKAWGPDKVSEPLKKTVMETDNLNLASNAMKALSEVGGTGTEDFFIERLKDPRHMVVIQAISELGNIKSSNAVEPLFDFLSLDYMRDGTLQITINSLTKIKDPRSAERLEKLLYSGVKSTTLKINLVKAISQINADKGFEIAEKEITGSTGDIRYFTALLNVFASLKEPRIVPILKDLKNEVGPGVGKKIDVAIESIENIGE